MRTAILILMLVPLAACSDRPEESASAPPSAAVLPASASMEGAHHFAEALREWNAWPDVYTKHQWSPALCDASTLPPIVPTHQQSTAPEESPHGRKLYRLTVSSMPEFDDLARAEPAIGFTAVKIAYAPKPEAPETPGDFVGLFIMKRIAEASDASTDQGWVYATTDAELRITSAGRIASCMACHADAPHGRLFGPLPGANRVTE